MIGLSPLPLFLAHTLWDDDSAGEVARMEWHLSQNIINRGCQKAFFILFLPWVGELGDFFTTVMKKILEVLQEGETDIRFDTDIQPRRNPSVIPNVTANLALAMVTSLWGGKEQAVLSMIRALAVADLAVSVNRKQMLKMLDESSAALARSFQEARAEFEKAGGKVQVFSPNIPKPTPKS